MAKLGNITGFAPVSNSNRERVQLPADKSFVCKIVEVKLEQGTGGERIELFVEIIEGEYTGFFGKDYTAQAGSGYGQKWRGVYRLTVPRDGSAYYENNLRRFNRAIGAIEASNPGFSFAATMDTDDLKDKMTGILTRAAEFNERTYSEIGMLLTVEDARAQRFKPMQKRISGEVKLIEKPIVPAPKAIGVFPGNDDHHAWTL